MKARRHRAKGWVSGLLMGTIMAPLAHGHGDRPLAAGYARQRLPIMAAEVPHIPSQQMSGSGNDRQGEDRAISLRKALNIGISACEIGVGP
jgi:hypothetical protein